MENRYSAGDKFIYDASIGHSTWGKYLRNGDILTAATVENDSVGRIKLIWFKIKDDPIIRQRFIGSDWEDYKHVCMSSGFRPAKLKRVRGFDGRQVYRPA